MMSKDDWKKLISPWCYSDTLRSRHFCFCQVATLPPSVWSGSPENVDIDKNFHSYLDILHKRFISSVTVAKEKVLNYGNHVNKYKRREPVSRSPSALNDCCNGSYSQPPGPGWVQVKIVYLDGEEKNANIYINTNTLLQHPPGPSWGQDCLFGWWRKILDCLQPCWCHRAGCTTSSCSSCPPWSCCPPLSPVLTSASTSTKTSEST